MRNFAFGAVTGVILFVLGVVLFLRLGFAETRGDLAPSWFEKRLMSAAVHASIGMSQANPLCDYGSNRQKDQETSGYFRHRQNLVAE